MKRFQKRDNSVFMRRTETGIVDQVGVNCGPVGMPPWLLVTTVTGYRGNMNGSYSDAMAGAPVLL